MPTHIFTDEEKEALREQMLEAGFPLLKHMLIGEDALTGKKKLGREDARRYLYAVIDEEISIYPHMTLEDEAKLFSGTKAFVPDLEKESAITAGLLSYLEHVRADVNLGLVANLCKVLIITVESRAELHEAVYEETLHVQIETILDLIFEA